MERVSYRNYRGHRGYTGYTGIVDVCVFKNLTELERMINKLKNRIKIEGYVTVAEYYEFTNGSVSKKDSEHGWKELDGFSIRPTRYGYELLMPSTELVITNPIQKVYDLLESADEDDLPAVVEDALDQLGGIL